MHLCDVVELGNFPFSMSTPLFTAKSATTSSVSCMPLLRTSRGLTASGTRSFMLRYPYHGCYFGALQLVTFAFAVCGIGCCCQHPTLMLERVSCVSARKLAYADSQVIVSVKI
jgi:hypothetical protein